MITGKQLRDRREALGLTQAAVGRLADLSEETVRKAESDLGVRPKTIAAIDAALTAAEAGVAPTDDDGAHVLLDLPEEALVGLTEVERDEVVTAARLAALQKAREIRGG